jgi:ACS family pantothenate transporter-like MFS transporter
MQTCWTVGYVIGEIPSNIILTKFRPRYWLPALEVCMQSCFTVYQDTNASEQLTWTILTFCTCKANSATQLYVIRFFVGKNKFESAFICRVDTNMMSGLAESAFYPGMQYIIGSWYRRDELAKRSCIFHTSSSIATMFSGYLMAAVYHLGGVGGFKGWQW